MIQIDKLLQFVIAKNGSDLHLHVGRAPVVRLHGRLKSLETETLGPEDTVTLMRSITPDRNQQELDEVGSTDFGFGYQDKARFRVAVFKQKGHISMALRLIPSRLMTLKEIGLPDIVESLLCRQRGLFLVTGPTGSGKTTTLASMINYINENFDRHIITIEEPIEYFHSHKKSMINQRELGTDVISFEEGVRRALRADPDVILIGEMRDLHTMEAAVRAAETGHLVFSTLHTTGAAGTVNRIVDAFPVEQKDMIRVQLASCLMAVISQTLVPRIDMPGRIAAYEFMLIKPAAQNLIRKNEPYRLESYIQTGRKYGMQLLDESLWDMYSRRIISADEMLIQAQRPEEIGEKLSETAEGREALKRSRGLVDESDLKAFQRTAAR
ncbi:MAG: type IV pilus twitching motility protein PilT [Planctomycetota bacterium]|jgi:twitching motility protein PilT|nr:type IV pilus twitching motility protein PilT [Planctomycetota bacterium]